MTSPDRHPDHRQLLALLEDELPREELAEIRRHVDACEACRDVLDELRSGYDVATLLRAGELDDLATRVLVRARLEASRADPADGPGRPGLPLPSGPPKRWRGLAAAAVVSAFALGAVAGVGLAPDASSVPDPALATAPATHLLLLGPPAPGREAPPISEYAGASARLRAEGRLLAAEVLADERRIVGAGSEQMERLDAAAGLVTGFYLVRAGSDSAAAEIARSMPSVAVGGSVLVWPIFPTEPAPPGDDPSAVQARPGDIFVANLGRDAVARFDGETGEYLGDFVPVGASPLQRGTGIAFGPDGDLYVASSGNDRILRYDGDTGRYRGVFAEDERLASPFSILFEEDGNLLVSAGRGHDVWRLDGATGEVLASVASDPELRPIGLALATDGSLLVADPAARGVARFDRATARRLDWTPDQPIGFPSDVALGPDGGVYVSSASGGVVLRLDLATGAVLDTAFAGPEGVVPMGLAFTRDGRLVVGDFGGGRLFLAPGPGSAPVEVSARGLAGPENIAVKR